MARRDSEGEIRKLARQDAKIARRDSESRQASKAQNQCTLIFSQRNIIKRDSEIARWDSESRQARSESRLANNALNVSMLSSTKEVVELGDML